MHFSLSIRFKLLSKRAFFPESRFINVLTTKLKDAIGLTDQEINELTDYFKVQNGQIAYVQFCSVIHDNGKLIDFQSDNFLATKPFLCNKHLEPQMPDNSDLVTGLEWEDHLAKNRLSNSENRRLRILLTKIAHSVRLRDVVLRPYFQDYELVFFLHL